MREIKNNIYSEISKISKAMSNSNRLEIIDYIANGEKCVEDIALQTGISIANASQHLQTLKKERLVMSRKNGVQVCYSLVSFEVYLVWKSLRDLTLSVSPYVKELLKDIRVANNYDEPLSLAEIGERDDVFFLDVRPTDEYEKEHINGAISIPIEELSTRLHEVSKDKLVIAYCRGMFCSIADEAVKLLHSKGYNAKKIEENIIDFQLVSEDQ